MNTFERITDVLATIGRIRRYCLANQEMDVRIALGRAELELQMALTYTPEWLALQDQPTSELIEAANSELDSIEALAEEVVQEQGGEQ